MEHLENRPSVSGWTLFEGIVLIALGIAGICLPGLMTLSAELLLGVILTVAGIVELYSAWVHRDSAIFATTALAGVIALACGLLLLFYPLRGVMTLTILLTLFFAVEGLLKLFLSFQMKGVEGWGWMLVSAILSLLIALIIWSGWPESAVWALGLLVGINLLFFGIARLMQYFSAQEST